MSYIDDLIEHKSLMEGQKTRVADQIIQMLESILPQIIGLTSTATQSNINKIVSDIKKIIDEEFDSLSPELQKQVMDLGEYEADFQKRLLDNAMAEGSTIAIKGVGRETLEAAFLKTPVQGLLFKDGLKRANADVKNQVETAVRIAVLNGSTANQAIKQVRGNYNIAEKRMVTFIRTSIQSVTNTATAETFKKNNVEKYKYLAILDSRTTKTCQDLNGKIFILGKGPIPPVHYNCRSFIVPIFEGIKLGDELDSNYASWLESSGKNGLKANEKGDFAETRKNITSLKALKEKEQKILIK